MMPQNTLALIAGLGNPGREYQCTRHNIGFLVVDAIAEKLATSDWRKRFGGEHILVSAQRMVLLKPMLFMNDSGPPLQTVANFYRIAPERCLVISDDLDLPFGKLRMRVSGGHGGHNGLRSIIAHFGENFPRLRIGIGRDGNAVVRHVLSNFEAAEQTQLEAIIAAAAQGCLMWAREGTDPAMRFLNTWQFSNS